LKVSPLKGNAAKNKIKGLQKINRFPPRFSKSPKDYYYTNRFNRPNAETPAAGVLVLIRPIRARSGVNGRIILIERRGAIYTLV